VNDHNMVEFFVKVDSDVIDSRTRFLNLSKVNYDGMRHGLAMMDWETLLTGKTVDRQWQTFKERIGELQKLFIPFWHKSCGQTMAYKGS